MIKKTHKQTRVRLGLGTVQLGLPYGATNSAGQVPQEQACRIIVRARDGGIDMLDTAVAYGESEEVLGRCLAATAGQERSAPALRIVTKTPVSLKDQEPAELPELLRRAFAASCRKLDARRLYGLLVHDVEDLLAPCGAAVWNELKRLRRQGRVEKIGFSAYSSGQIAAVLERFEPDMVQLPMNAIDRRLIDSGILATLRAGGIEIHARSLFLQGVLLQSTSGVAGFFAPLARSLAVMDEVFQAAGASRLAGLLAVIWQTGLVDRLIVGVTSCAELDEILAAARAAERLPWLELPGDVFIRDERLLNPSMWPGQT
jgi:aryl-alcohol dehydrogenase-like predicted oxidoreductase